MRRRDLCFLRLRAETIGAFIVGLFFELEEGETMGLGIVNIHLMDLGQKIEDGFGLHGNDFPKGLIADVFSMAILFDLGIDRGPKPIAK